LILITHRPAILPGLADRLLVLRNGKLVEHGNLRDVYLNPAAVYTAGLLRSATASGG
jgi:ABC-type glutathione transport system ATPase component